MNFGENETPVEVIREGAFGGTYYRNIYSGATRKWYKKSWEEFYQPKNFEKYCSDYYDASVNKYGVKCGISLIFWENKGWINKTDPYGLFQRYFRYWLGRRSSDDEKKVNR